MTRPTHAAPALALAALLLAGCSSPGPAGGNLTSVGLSGEDTGALMPVLRVSNERVKAVGRAREVGAVRGRGPRLGGKFFSSEFVLRGDYGGYDDALAPGQTLAVDGATTTGPVSVDVDVHRTELRAIGRGGDELQYGFGFEALAGIGLDAFFADLSAPGFDESVETYAWGGSLGAGFTYTPQDFLQLRAMFEFSVGVELEEYSLLQTGSFELLLVGAVHPKVRLLGGWRAVEMRHDWGDFGGDDSLDIDARLQGFVFGVWLAM